MSAPTKHPRRVCPGCGKKIKGRSHYEKDQEGRAWHRECFEARFGRFDGVAC